jgi:hypothetical protein
MKKRLMMALAAGALMVPGVASAEPRNHVCVPEQAQAIDATGGDPRRNSQAPPHPFPKSAEFVCSCE